MLPLRAVLPLLATGNPVSAGMLPRTGLTITATGSAADTDTAWLDTGIIGSQVGALLIWVPQGGGNLRVRAIFADNNGGAETAADGPTLIQQGATGAMSTVLIDASRRYWRFRPETGPMTLRWAVERLQ